MKTIAILGSTGSIGTQTLEVVRENQDIRVAALAAGNNITLLEQQIREFTPKTAAVWTEEKAKELRAQGILVSLIQMQEGRSKDDYLSYAMKDHVSKVEFIEEA